MLRIIDDIERRGHVEADPAGRCDLAAGGLIPAPALSRWRPPRRGCIRWSSPTRMATRRRSPWSARSRTSCGAALSLATVLDRRAELLDLVPRLAHEAGLDAAASRPRRWSMRRRAALPGARTHRFGGVEGA